MPPEESLGQFLWLRNAWCAREARLEAKPSTLVLKVQETPELSSEQSARPVTPAVIHDQSRQVAKSPVDVTLPANGPARRLGGDYLGSDACLGPRLVTNAPNGLTTENSAQIP